MLENDLDFPNIYVYNVYISCNGNKSVKKIAFKILQYKYRVT